MIYKMVLYEHIALQYKQEKFEATLKSEML